MQSLGVLEVKGLAMAVAACDTMLKAANVEFLGHEFAKGGGWCNIKILGEVAAVRAALDAGEALASRHNALVSQTLIARPTQDVDQMVMAAHREPAKADTPKEQPKKQ